jgi:flagellar export protein FliJ
VKSLRTLLKLARRDLETLRRALADQIARQTTVEERILGHEQTIRAEQSAALRDYESTRAYGGFAVFAVTVRRALEAELATIAAEIGRLRTLITEAHVESRKFERLIELDEAREHAAREKRENAELDEMATQRSGRKAVGQ